MLSVLHISTADNLGGSARSAYRIHRGLRELGHRSRMLVRTRVTNDPDVGFVHGGRPLVRAIDLVGRHLVDRLDLQYWWYPSSYLLPRHPWFCEADIIQLYNTHGGYFSHLALPRISRRRPVVWRLSDMWPLTGHCAYSHDCERWQIGCGSCPILGEYPALKRDTTALLWRTKKLAYDRSRIVVVVTNLWMAGLVKESPLLGRFPVRMIPNGVDTAVFRPVPKASARESLGIPPHAKVVLFSAHVAATGTRKGGEYVRPGLERVVASGIKDLILLVIGEGAEAWEESAHYPTIRIGFTQSDRLLASVYSAADVLLHPAVAENLANGIIESLACGTPVVAFRVGGVADVVRDGETGYLARLRDVEDLGHGLRTMLEGEGLRKEIGEECRRTVERGYTSEREIRGFAALYDEIVHPSRGRWAPTSVLQTKERVASMDPQRSQVPQGPTCDFRETSYGIVKRVQVFSGWIEDFKRCEGRQTVSILDFGCGTGLTLTRPLGRTGDAILGVDTHAASVEVAERQNPFKNVRYRVADISDLMSRGERFDVVICSEVLEHLRDPEKYLDAFRRLLKTPGILILSVPNGHGPFEQLKRVERHLDHLGIDPVLVRMGQGLRSLAIWTLERLGRRVESPRLGWLNEDSPHINFFRLPDLEAMCRRGGFKAIDRRGRSFVCGPYADFWLNRWPIRLLLPLNNALVDWLPPRFCSDWMLLLRKLRDDN